MPETSSLCPSQQRRPAVRRVGQRHTGLGHGGGQPVRERTQGAGSQHRLLQRLVRRLPGNVRRGGTAGQVFGGRTLSRRAAAASGSAGQPATATRRAHTSGHQHGRPQRHQGYGRTHPRRAAGCAHRSGRSVLVRRRGVPVRRVGHRRGHVVLAEGAGSPARSEYSAGLAPSAPLRAGRPPDCRSQLLRLAAPLAAHHARLRGRAAVLLRHTQHAACSRAGGLTALYRRIRSGAALGRSHRTLECLQGCHDRHRPPAAG